MKTIRKMQYSDPIQDIQIVDNINEIIDFMDAVAATIHEQDETPVMLKRWAQQYKYRRSRA